MLPQWHVKDPGHSAKSAGGRLHLNTHTPLAQRSRSGLTMPLSRHSVGTSPETRSHATCRGIFGHSRLSPLNHCTHSGLKSGISVRQLISTLTTTKMRRRGMNSRTFSQNPRTRGTCHHHTGSFTGLRSRERERERERMNFISQG